MAKADTGEGHGGAQQRAILQAAWERFEAGDMVEARRLANAVLAGQQGPDEDAVAADLAKRMTAATPIGTSPREVALALRERTAPVPKSYLFAALTLTIFTVLVTLALTRYGHA